MSEENVEIVRRSIEAYWAGDYEAAMSAYSPDVEYDVSIRPEGRVYRGHAGVVEAVRTWAGTWDDWTAETEEIIDAGDKVLVFDRQTGRGKGSGAPLDERTSWVYSLRDGRISRVKWFATRQEAIEAAGLSARSGENVAVVRRICEGWAMGDFERPEATDLDPHVTFVVRPPLESAVLVGRDEIGKYMRAFLEQWERVTIEAKRLQAIGDTVLAHVVQHHKGRASGIEGDLPYYMLFTFRGGRIVRIESLVDEDEAREAAGLEE